MQKEVRHMQRVDLHGHSVRVIVAVLAALAAGYLYVLGSRAATVQQTAP